jgi:hypothetical protein
MPTKMEGNRMKWILGAAAALSLAASPSIAAEFGSYGMSALRIAVKDEARSKLFYSNLGMKVGRLHHPGQQEMAWENPNQGPAIILMSQDTKMTPGTASFLMYVPSLTATVKELRDAGFRNIPDPKPTNPRFTEVPIQDPDGNTILLIGPVAEIESGPARPPSAGTLFSAVSRRASKRLAPASSE